MTPGTFIADNSLKGVGTREVEGKWLVDVGVFPDSTVDRQKRWIIEVDNNTRFAGAVAGDLKRGQNERRLQRIDCEQTACSPQRTLLLEERFDHVRLSQGRTVIFAGRLGPNGFHVPMGQQTPENRRVHDHGTR